MNYLACVDYCFHDRPGGAARVAWDIAALMRDRGHQTALLCGYPNAAQRPTSVETIDGIRVVRFSTPLLPPWHPKRGDARIEAGARAVRETLGGERWDLAHLHMPYPGSGVVRALGDQTRYAYTVHSPVTLENRINWATQGWVGRVKIAFGGLRVLRAAEGALLRRARAVHVLSDFTKKSIESEHGMPGICTVIPHWRRPDLRRELDRAEARRRLGWPLDQKIIFTVRIHGPRYGIDLAIKAIGPLLVKHNARFYVGGDGPLRLNFERIARDLGVADRIPFLGRLSDADLRLAYQAADLFVLPTVALECFGLITLEAMSFGVPVIGTDAGATPEILNAITPGTVVKAGDIDSMRAKVEEYLSGRLRLPDDAHIVDFVERRYGRESVAPRIAELLENAAIDSGSRTASR